MIAFGRVTLFFVCLWYSLVPVAYLSAYLSHLAPHGHGKFAAFLWFFLTWLVSAALVGSVACFPIAWVYGRAAPWVALSLSLPFAATRLFRLPSNASVYELTLVWSSVVVYSACTAGATMLARRHMMQRRMRRNSEIEIV